MWTVLRIRTSCEKGDDCDVATGVSVYVIPYQASQELEGPQILLSPIRGEHLEGWPDRFAYTGNQVLIRSPSQALFRP